MRKTMNMNKHTNIEKTSNNYIHQTSKYTTNKCIQQKKTLKKNFKQQF